MAYNPLAFGLMLTSTGSLIFAAYLYRKIRGAGKDEDKGFGAIFTLLGGLAAIFGLSLYFQETIPGQYIEVYGVGYIVFALLMITAGLTVFNNWSRKPAAFLASLGGVILGHSALVILSHAMSKSPLASAGIFGFAGLGAILTAKAAYAGEKNIPKWVITLAILFFVFMGVLGMYTGLSAQNGHITSALAAAAAAAAKAAGTA